MPYSMIEGEAYTFNFPGCPAGFAVYQGTVEVAGATWIVLVKDPDGPYEEYCYYNPALLATLRPESLPR